MTPSAIFWSFFTGLVGCLLLGHLFSTYEDLRGGAIKLMILIALTVIAFGGANVVMAVASAQKVDPIEIRQTIIANVALAGAFLAVLFIVIALGG